MGKYAEYTTVPSARSRAEIEHTLTRFGATAFAYGTGPGWAQVVFEIHDLRVIYRLPLPDRDAHEFTYTRHQPQYRQERLSRETGDARYEQAVRQRWRALLVSIKAKLAAVEAGISTVEEEFLSHVAVPQGGTVGDVIIPSIAGVYAGNPLPQLMPGGTR